MLPTPMLPDSSNNPPSHGCMLRVGRASVRPVRENIAKMLCAMDVPVAPTETPITPAGLPAQALWP